MYSWKVLCNIYFQFQTIPSGIGQLTYLTNLDLKDNGLSGYVPTELFNLTNLVKLDLSYNVNYDGNCTRFDGTEKDIPISFGLEGMILDSNIGRLENLQDIDLTDNYFSGSICESDNRPSVYHLCQYSPLFDLLLSSSPRYCQVEATWYVSILSPSTLNQCILNRLTFLFSCAYLYRSLV